METCCLPQGPGHEGLTHLQARSPLALATVQSRPVALRPMLPTTASRTYCLCRAGRRGRGQPTTCPPTAPPEWGNCPPREVRATQLESKQKKTSDKPRMGRRGWCFHERAGLAASQCQRHRKQREAENCSRYRTLRRRDSDMQSMTLAWILTREKNSNNGSTGD